MKVSLNRQQVDQALANRGTSLPTYIEAGRAQGKSIEEIAKDLQDITRVPFTVRTLYRWVNKLEKANA
jgi:hypothetical protein